MARANAAPVPEPSTLAIFALGMFGLVSRKFNKKN
ncbi:PEP-CTERM sorting domain-containing protein [Thalassotalea sp. PLHSN55]